MASDCSMPRLGDRTFRLLLHDLHHAYLLLHRAFLQLPPTLIPDLEPMPHPCHEDLHQPAGLQPYDSAPPDSADIEIPSDTETDKELFQIATDKPLPHRAPRAKFPSPVWHLPAPEEGHIPLPSSLQTSTLRADPPTKTKRPRKSQTSATDKQPLPSKPSRSRAPLTSPRPWTGEDKATLRALSGNASANMVGR